MATENYCTSGCDLPPSESSKKPRISSEAANLPPTMISSLADDLLVEILIRSFPNPKSACRSKAVCKRWSSLISSPRFNRRFVSHQQSMNLRRPPMPDIPNELRSVIHSFLPPMPNGVRDTLRVLDCNKDLVLCGFWDLDTDNGEPGRSYLVCNPFTKQWIALPLAPEKVEGYIAPVARLVCEPRSSSNLDLGDDDGEATFVYSEYRFRVVCIYKYNAPQVSVKLDVFCSESGDWTKEALVLDDSCHAARPDSISSCNGELFWLYHESVPGGMQYSVAVFNPFRLDIPPTLIDASAFPDEPLFLSVSQGALHLIDYKCIVHCVTVWRLEEDRKSWKKQCEGLVKKKLSRCSGYEYEPEGCYQPFLHPHKPEIVFFHYNDLGYSAFLSYDLRREELEFIAELERFCGKSWLFKVFEPRVSCWPTPIHRYKELQGMYDGSYSFWVQSSSEATTTPSIDN